MAIGLVVLLLECALVELLQAEGAHEMLGMEFAEHGGDASAGDGLGASGAQRSPLRVVVGLTIRQSLVVEERSAVERLPAILKANKRIS